MKKTKTKLDLPKLQEEFDLELPKINEELVKRYGNVNFRYLNGVSIEIDADGNIVHPFCKTEK